jgi:hypothetical protein
MQDIESRQFLFSLQPTLLYPYFLGTEGLVPLFSFFRKLVYFVEPLFFSIPFFDRAGHIFTTILKDSPSSFSRKTQNAFIYESLLRGSGLFGPCSSTRCNSTGSG